MLQVNKMETSTTTKVTTHLGQEKPCESYINKNTFIDRFSEDTSYESIPIETMAYLIKSRQLRVHDSQLSGDVLSMAYECGLGYNSLFLVASHSPLFESNTSLHKEVKNSLNTPPPSMPALITSQHQQPQRE